MFKSKTQEGAEIIKIRGCVQIWGAKFNSRRDSVPLELRYNLNRRDCVLLELRSSSILIAVGFNPRNKERVKRISSNNLFLLPSEGGREEKELKRLASRGARRDSIIHLIYFRNPKFIAPKSEKKTSKVK